VIRSFLNRRVVSTFLFSYAGLKQAWRSEEAFRIEVAATAFLAPLGLYLGDSGSEKALLLAALILVLIVELLNTGLEKVIDRISLEQHDLSKVVKDIGSAAVLLSLVLAACIWGLVIFW
jgi:diacylglycerol kinase (ATP)